MRIRFLLVISFALSATSTWSQELDYRTKFEITALGGYQFGGALDETYKIHGVENVGQALGIKGSEVAGLIADLRLGPKLQLELAFDRHLTQLNLHDEEQTVTKLADMNVDNYQAGLIYVWSSRSTQLFVGGTVGATNLNPGGDFSNEVRFTAAPVFGVKTFASRHFGFRFQTRLLVTNMRKGQYFENSSGVSYEHTLNSYMTQLHAAVGLIVGW